MRVNLKGQSVGSDPGLEAAVDVEAEALEAAPCRVMLLPQPCPHRPRRVCRPQPFLPHPLLPAHTTRVSPRRPVTRTSSSSARRQHTRQRQQPQDKSGVGGAREERGCGGGACVGGVKCRGTGGGRGQGPLGSGGERACRRQGPTQGSCPPRPHSPPLHTLTHSTEREREREREREERGEADLPKRKWVWEGAVCLAAAAREEAEGLASHRRHSGSAPAPPPPSGDATTDMGCASLRSAPPHSGTVTRRHQASETRERLSSSVAAHTDTQTQTQTQTHTQPQTQTQPQTHTQPRADRRRGQVRRLRGSH